MRPDDATEAGPAAAARAARLDALADLIRRYEAAHGEIDEQEVARARRSTQARAICVRG